MDKNIRASLIVKSTKLKHEEMSRLIWFLPDKSWNKDDKMIISGEWNGKNYRSSSFILESKIESEFLEDYIVDILWKLERYEKNIIQLSVNPLIDIELYITKEYDKNLSWFHLDKWLLKKLSNFWISIDVDLLNS
jgi:hypothetical protein